MSNLIPLAPLDVGLFGVADREIFRVVRKVSGPRSLNSVTSSGLKFPFEELQHRGVQLS